MASKVKRGAGLRPSALANLIQIREEWSALKEDEKENVPISNTNSKNKPRKGKNGNRKVKTKLKFGEGVEKIDILKGTVALVSVGEERYAMALRASLRAMGASVLQEWSPIVTHVVWTEGGCRAIRSRARALAARLVSPQWVEACAALGLRVPERQFPSASRPSDLPSPATLRQMLKRAEIENLPLANFLTDSKEGEDPKAMRLRMSTDSESDVDIDPQSQKPKNKEKAPPKRPLYTHKDPQTSQECSDENTVTPKTRLVTNTKCQVTPKQKRDLASAARLARRQATVAKPTSPRLASATPYIVLTGMHRSQKLELHDPIRKLGGRVQPRVNLRTTHVLVADGACVFGAECPSRPLCPHGSAEHLRTFNALMGAARGCRILRVRWIWDSFEAGRWLHHNGYEARHQWRVCKKAQAERTVLSKCVRNYCYNVFYGLRVKVSSASVRPQEVTQLLRLCGASVFAGDADTAVDVTIGNGKGEVSCEWVFDSVIEGRTRATKRYVNKGYADSIVYEC